MPEKGMTSLIGLKTSDVRSILGLPNRIEPSFYGYDWWVYQESPDHYLQVGVENGRIVTVIVLGDERDITPFSIGQPIQEIFQKVVFVTDVEIEFEGTSYRFELTEEDLNLRPLVKIGDIYAQLYFDRYTQKLSSVRFLNAETLIKQQPYELIYRGALYEPEPLTHVEWTRAAEAAEKQIFEMTNVMRDRFDLPQLEWDPLTSEVAFAHSKDMFENQYFSHTSPTNGELKDRLEAVDVLFEMAGENIAAQYTDAEAVIEGWLNSEGHRETMLQEEYTHLGVGVYRKYYTQNFLKKSWEIEPKEGDGA